MLPLLAQAEMSNTVMIGIVVVGLSSVSGLAVSLIAIFRFANGKANERQIEPTQLAAIQAELRTNHGAVQAELRQQTTALNKLDRESGEMKTSVSGLEKQLDQLRSTEIPGLFKKIGAIGTESTENRTRIEKLEQSESERRQHERNRK